MAKAKLNKVASQLELTLMGVYLVQKLGKPTIQEIKKVAEEKLGVTFYDNNILRALEGASRRNLVAINQTMMENGITAKVFSMKDPQRWKAAPEYAMFSDLLPQLLHTDAAAEIKSWFDAQEKAGDSKTTRGNDVDDYNAYRITAVLLDPIIGSQIRNQRLEAIHRKFPNDLDKDSENEDSRTEGLFERDENDGAYLIPSDVLQGWFMTNITRIAGLQDARAKYVAFYPIRFPYKETKIVQSVLPVQSKQGSGAPKSHETIPAGIEFEINFLCPSKGVLNAAQLERAFLTASCYSRRGISPARGIRYGHFLMTGFQNLGAVKNISLDFIQHVVPPAFMEKYGGYLKEAVKRLSSVSLSPSASKVTRANVGNFPLTNGNGASLSTMEDEAINQEPPAEEACAE